jgi:hypothetical protein
MRPTTFHSAALRQLIYRHCVATLDQLQQALGTPVIITVFRKLKELDYLTSYSHRGRYYTLRDVAQFDQDGLWSHQSVWFSRQGTLLDTAEVWVRRSPQGYFAEELARRLHVTVQDTLLELVQRRRLARQPVQGRYLYTAAEAATRNQQLAARRAVPAVGGWTVPTTLQIAPQELQAAILLFYSLLDEKQRRLYAGLESLKIGHGGDRQLAELLGLDAHTVARGRQ